MRNTAPGHVSQSIFGETWHDADSKPRGCQETNESVGQGRAEEAPGAPKPERARHLRGPGHSEAARRNSRVCNQAPASLRGYEDGAPGRAPGSSVVSR